jgi:hypothetical protein
MSIVSEIRGMLAMVKSRPHQHDDLAAVEAAEAALTRANHERTTALASMVALRERRIELLMSDAADSVVAATETGMSKIERNLERLELLEPELAASLRAARTTVRQRRWAETVAAWNLQVAKFCGEFRAANTEFHELIAIIARAESEGFGPEARLLFEQPPRMIGADDMIDQFQRTQENRADAAARPLPAAKIAPVAAPVVEPVAAARIPAAKPRIKPAPKAEEPGDARVVVVRGGFETPDGISHATGAEIWMPRDIATKAVLRGSVEFVSVSERIEV